MNMPLWFSNLAFWSVQSALLVAAAGFLPYLLQIRQPRVLLGYWRTVLAITLSLPFLQPWHHVHVIGLGAIAMAPDIAGSSLTPPPDPTVTQWLFLSPQIIAGIFGFVILTGIAGRLAIFVLGLLNLRHFRQASSPISPFAEAAAVFQEISHRVNARAEFRLSAQVDSPVTFGFAAPVILLPGRVTSMKKNHRRCKPESDGRIHLCGKAELSARVHTVAYFLENCGSFSKRGNWRRSLTEVAKIEKAQNEDCEAPGDSRQNHEAENPGNDLRAEEKPLGNRGIGWRRETGTGDVRRHGNRAEADDVYVMPRLQEWK